MALKISEMFARAVPRGQMFTQGTVQPVNPIPGDEWLDESSGVLFTFVNDGNAGQWIELGPQQSVSGNATPVTGASVLADTAPASPGTWPTLTDYRISDSGAGQDYVGMHVVWVPTNHPILPAAKGWRVAFAPVNTVL